MITGISNTPRFFVANNSRLSNSNNNNAHLNLSNKMSNGLTTDTITFTSSYKDLNKIADSIFIEVAKNRRSGKLGYYLGTNKRKVNIHINETKFGKEATVAFSNGKFKNKDFTMMQIEKESSSKAKLTSLDSDYSNREAYKLLVSNLKKIIFNK